MLLGLWKSTSKWKLPLPNSATKQMFPCLYYNRPRPQMRIYSQRNETFLDLHWINHDTTYYQHHSTPLRLPRYGTKPLRHRARASKSRTVTEKHTCKYSLFFMSTTIAEQSCTVHDHTAGNVIIVLVTTASQFLNDTYGLIELWFSEAFDEN